MKKRTVTAAEIKKLAAKKPKRNKFNARRTTVDGITFHSAKEASRYSDLRLRLLAKEIQDLRCQYPFELVCNQMVICKYIADFRYYDVRRGCYVVEDVKSPPTRKLEAYRIKKKFMAAYHRVFIEEV